MALALAAGAVGYFLARGSEHAVSLGQPPQQASTTQAVQQTGALPSARSFEVWFAKDGHLVEALRTHSATRRVATAALDALLAGPTPSERAAGLRSEIPTGTRLLGVAIAGGVARVDLTPDFESAASSRSLQLRLAQVVYTATQFPTVKQVRFSVGGTPIAALGHAVGRTAYRPLAPLPLAGRWRPLPPGPLGALTARAGTMAGSQLLVLGRARGMTAFAGFRPASRVWRRLSAPVGLGASFRTVWTGRELIAWGSKVSAYDPASGRWRRLPRPPIAGSPELLAWTGRELLGWNASGGAAYRPGAGWRTLPAAPLEGAAAWTGRELVVVDGGRAAAFRPGRGWLRLPAPPEALSGANAVWDGEEVLLVGGDKAPASAFAYSPAANTWRSLASLSSGRKGSAVVWTGSRLLLWGGETGTPGHLVIPPHGLAYDPKADRWSSLPQAPLQGRLDPVGVWTGRSLLVWGGDPAFADGASFTPSG
jgi:hypothetical protein